MVNTVKGEYESYKGFGKAPNRKRKRIRRVWSTIPIFLDVAGEDVNWNYVPPRWLFPPPAPFVLNTT